MRAAVIGAGWAGLSAAVSLQRRGWTVTVFEAAPAIGGRARSITSGRLGLQLDNGQHILLSAYTETLSLLHSLHGALDAHCLTLPLAWESADGCLSLRVPNQLPGRLALAWGLASARGLSPSARGRAALALVQLAVARWRTTPGTTVSQWLDRTRQPGPLRECLWHPLCLATMNTPAPLACAQLFAHVLRDSLGKGSKACHIVLPRVTLGELWRSAEVLRLDLRLRHPVRHITWLPAPDFDRPMSIRPDFQTPPSGSACTRQRAHRPCLEIDAERFDAVVIATPASVAHRLLRRLPSQSAARNYLDALEHLTSLPIATLYLRLSAPWPLPRPMLMLRDAPQLHQFGQWVFDRAACVHDGQPILGVVISDARGLTGLDEQTIVDGIVQQLQSQLRRAGPMPAIDGHHLIVEKRATFAALPNLKRPACNTPWQGIFVAGDWTDTGYPAVLEGAVRSGLQAARLATEYHPGTA